MNWTLLNVVSDVYTVALLRNMKQQTVVKRGESRLSKFMKFIQRG